MSKSKDLGYDHSDYCHCSDWKNDICPEDCFRARITKELRSMDPPYQWPVSYANFRKSGYCPLGENSEVEDAASES